MRGAFPDFPPDFHSQKPKLREMRGRVEKTIGPAEIYEWISNLWRWESEKKVRCSRNRTQLPKFTWKVVWRGWRWNWRGRFLLLLVFVKGWNTNMLFVVWTNESWEAHPTQTALPLMSGFYMFQQLKKNTHFIIPDIQKRKKLIVVN